MRLFLILIFSLLCAIPPLSAQVNGIDQASDLVTVGSDKFLRWYGHADRTYFIQVSDPNDHLNKWTWAPIIESGNDEDISYEVDGTADKGFFRLKYTNAPSGGNPDTADFDNDGVSNLSELQAGLDPFNFADADNDGLPNDWETVHAGTFAVYPGALGAEFQSSGSATRALILSNATSQPVSYSVALQNNELPVYSSQSSATGGPAFSWEDISGTGTLLATVSGGDDVSQTVNLNQFSFPYYGSTYAAVHVSSNGYLTLGAPSTAYGNTKLPMPSSPSLLIAPLWDDLNPGAEGDVYVQEFNNRLVIQYQQVARYSGAGTLTFEVILYSSGEIDFRYLSLTASVTACTVGIQNVDGTQGLQLAFNQAYLGDQFAVRIRPVTTLFSLNQLTGTIPSQSQTSLIGTFSGAGLNPGTYTAQGQVSHDGVGANPITIPAVATITALDTDGDLIPDSYEIANDLNPLVDDTTLDRDDDSLTNLQEYQLGTLANQHDTDGDGLSDGWEILYGYFALVNNETDADQTNDPDDDPDSDGLLNSAEDQIGTNPNSEDTDGDGFSDQVENEAASSATNSASTPGNPGGTPGGPAAPPPPTIPVQVTFGDHSESHSEKYRVWLEPLEGDTNTQKRYRTNRKYGQTQTETFHLPAGAKYKITLTHIGTDPEYDDDPKPDYDYTLEFTSNSTDDAVKAIPEDTAGMLGVHGESENFFAEGKDATLYIAWMTSETVATQPQDRKRKRLGVGEEVNLTLKPASLPSPTWALTGTQGTSQLNPLAGITSMLTAGERACTPSTEATILGELVKIDFDVIEPTGVTMQQEPGTGVWHIQGRPSAGFMGRPFITPIDVSFIEIQVREGQCNATGNGYYGYANGDPHPDGAWVDVVTGDASNPSKVDGVDTIRSGTAPNDQGHLLPDVGTFDWPIPWLFRVGSGGEKQFAIVTHHHESDAAGTVTISKGGTSVSAAINDPTAP